MATVARVATADILSFDEFVDLLRIRLGAAARAWPDARLVLIDDSGHTGSETMTSEILDTLERFARS
jgi:hypothetical protein